MKFSIITPSFRSSKWLKLCVASIADQGVELEHIIQDSCSDDGTQLWLPHDRRVKAFFEKDAGMYDAVNRGLKRASGDILAYLNCDEQYLPGALLSVEKFFMEHPNVDVAFGDVIIVDTSGNFLCYRKSILPLEAHSLVSGNLSIVTCATFFRRSVLDRHGLFFSSKLRDLGDADWVIRCIRKKIPMGLVPAYTSTFADTGENMNLKPNAVREKQELFSSAPAWLRRSRSLIVLHHRLRKLTGGAYLQKPFSYSIFTSESEDRRVRFDVQKPVARWTRFQPAAAPKTAPPNGSPSVS